MKNLDSFHIDIKLCWVELEEFENLLRDNKELNERKDILPFFKEIPHLSASIGWYSPDSYCNQIKHEFTLFGDFRADLVVGDYVNNIYCFIEFEDATEDSIFVNKEVHQSGRIDLNMDLVKSLIGFGKLMMLRILLNFVLFLEVRI